MRFAVCTAEDLPELTGLYLAVFPDRRPEDLSTAVPDTWWAAMKTDSGEIALAAYVSDAGDMLVLVCPDQAELLEIQDAFITLAQEVFKILRPFGVRRLGVAFPPQLGRFCEALEYSGSLKEAMLIREVQFTESGEVAREVTTSGFTDLFLKGLLTGIFAKGESR